MGNLLRPSHCKTESNRVVFWSQRCSAWCSPLCYAEAFRACEPGIKIRFRTDGKLFNPRRLQAVTKVKETVLRDFLFADDCTLNADDEQEMQAENDSFSTVCNNFSLTISTKKTVVMFQLAPGSQYEPQISLNGQTIQAVETFTYLGSTFSRNVNIGSETSARIAKASSAFRRLRGKCGRDEGSGARRNWKCTG